MVVVVTFAILHIHKLWRGSHSCTTSKEGCFQRYYSDDLAADEVNNVYVLHQFEQQHHRQHLPQETNNSNKSSLDDTNFNSNYCNLDCLPRNDYSFGQHHHHTSSTFGHCMDIEIPTNKIEQQQQQQQQQRREGRGIRGRGGERNYQDDSANRTTQELQQRSVQLILVLAGLRGAVSLALVESMPAYTYDTSYTANNTNPYEYTYIDDDDNISDSEVVGTTLKSEIKAMTSATILFTIFVFGGSAHYILRWLQLSPEHRGGGIII